MNGMKLLKDANGYTVEYDPEHGTTWLRAKDYTVAFQNGHITIFNDHSYSQIVVKDARTDSGWQSHLVLRSEPVKEQSR